MSLYKQFATDKNLERDGIVLNYGTNSRGQPIDIRIARAGGSNAKFATVAEMVFKPHRRAIAHETIALEVLDGLLRTIYAKAVVLGWSGVEDAEGETLEFSEDNVVKLFTDLPDLFADVKQAAEKAALFRKDALEAEAKN